MQRFEIDFLTDYDDGSLLAELKRIAKATGSETVTKKAPKLGSQAVYREGNKTTWTSEINCNHLWTEGSHLNAVLIRTPLSSAIRIVP
jgi:hypothetical protein